MQATPWGVARRASPCTTRTPRTRGTPITTSGTTSVVNDNLILGTVQLPPNKPTLLLRSKTVNSGVPFQDGILCLSGQIFRFGPKISSLTGTVSYGPGMVAQSRTGGVNGWILQGWTWNFQTYYRDIFLSPCLQKANITNVIQATFTP